MTKATSGEWILSPASDLTSAQLRQGIASLNAALQGGPTARIAASLMRLISATRRPNWMDDETAAVYFDTLQEALHDYPIDCVEDACIAWRKGEAGQWWPAEKELRSLCENLFHERRKLRGEALKLLSELERQEELEEEARQRSAFAGDEGRRFREEMRKRMPAARHAAYFDPSQIMFSARDIWVRTQTSERVLNEEGGDLLKRLGLRVLYQPQAFGKVRQPTWEDDSEADRAKVTRKFNRLTQAMAKGEDLKRLRASGEI